ncbi:MAG: putative colanic acid biosynthesis acetyltransferase [Phycisphaerales bacterium]|nr:putative colanic acid biosynthesis acetyltransferase [Phycisphaerales bacterium]
MTGARPTTSGQDAELEAGFARAKVSPWTTGEKVRRGLWMVLRVPLFRLSWHNWYGWRRGVLRAFGARIGRSCTIRPTARIEVPWLLEMDDGATLGDYAIVYNLGPVRIGRRTTISQYAHLCAGTHDMNRADLPLLRPPITIGADCWIAADSFVGPGVAVADGCVLGARSNLFADTEPWGVYVGSPARRIRDRERPGAG